MATARGEGTDQGQAEHGMSMGMGQADRGQAAHGTAMAMALSGGDQKHPFRADDVLARVAKDRDLMFDAAGIASAGEIQWSSQDARTLSRVTLGRRLLWCLALGRRLLWCLALGRLLRH